LTPPELARWRRYVDASLRGLDISRPDIKEKIFCAGDVDRNLMVSKAEIVSNDLISRQKMFGSVSPFLGSIDRTTPFTWALSTTR
jgi:hypothetical protein